MRVAYSKPLFAWDCLEDSPSLATIKAFLTAIPDGRPLDGLRQARGRGRDDYPVRVLWGTVLLTVILRHPSWEACLAERCSTLFRRSSISRPVLFANLASRRVGARSDPIVGPPRRAATPGNSQIDNATGSAACGSYDGGTPWRFAQAARSPSPTAPRSPLSAKNLDIP